MEIAESIYEGVVQPSNKKPAREDANSDGLRRKIRVEAALSNTYFDMSESSGRRRKKYVDHLKDRSKINYLIHGPVNSSDKSKGLGDFGCNYAKVGTIKELRQGPETRKKFERQKDHC